MVCVRIGLGGSVPRMADMASVIVRTGRGGVTGVSRMRISRVGWRGAVLHARHAMHVMAALRRGRDIGL